MEVTKQEIDELLEQNARISIAYLANRMVTLERDNSYLLSENKLKSDRIAVLSDQVRELERRLDRAGDKFRELERKMKSDTLQNQE